MQDYEARIDALQKQVEEQSMTMSMYSSMSAATNMEDSHIMLSSSYLSHVDEGDDAIGIDFILHRSQLAIFSFHLLFHQQKMIVKNLFNGQKRNTTWQ